MTNLPVVSGGTAISTIASIESLEPGAFGAGRYQLSYDPHLPAECPPSDAISGPKTLFRFLDPKKSVEDEFKTPHELGKFKDKDACQRCSLSALPTLEAALEMQAVVTYFRNHKIYKGDIPADAGRMKHTGHNKNPHHWSWWPALGISRPSYFGAIS